MAKNKNAEKKPNIFQKIGGFFTDCKRELKKIVWPTIKTTFKNTGVVLSSIVICAIFIGALDFGLTELLSVVMNITR